ncbi:MAG: hypothetical protein QOI51_273 [Nocardioidaceae bacterium]|nr:hypothetical protein [Nocardioidaceae bacterium]
MTYDDAPAVERLTATAFYQLSLTTNPANWPPPQLRSGERASRWAERLRHLLEHDAPGCWVVEQEGAVVGCSVALLREGMWGLSSLAVHPDMQGRGLGRQLLEAALTHGPWSAGLICSSSDPKAIRRYRLAGFEIHPTMLMWGRVRREAIPALPGLRDGTVADIDLLDDIDRSARGFAHGIDHEILVRQLPLLVTEDGSSRGYAYVMPGGSPYLVAATDHAAAQVVLWGALAFSTPDVPIDFSEVTSHQTWAVDLGLSAGLELHNYGYLAVREMAVPTPYLPCGHFL